MTCPFCAGEMVQGVVQGGSGLYWIPGTHAKAAPDLRAGARPLCHRGLFQRVQAEAWLCPTCNKAILDCPPPGSSLG